LCFDYNFEILSVKGLEFKGLLHQTGLPGFWKQGMEALLGGSQLRLQDFGVGELELVAGVQIPAGFSFQVCAP